MNNVFGCAYTLICHSSSMRKQPRKIRLISGAETWRGRHFGLYHSRSPGKLSVCLNDGSLQILPPLGHGIRRKPRQTRDDGELVTNENDDNEMVSLIFV